MQNQIEEVITITPKKALKVRRLLYFTYLIIFFIPFLFLFITSATLLSALAHLILIIFGFLIFLYAILTDRETPIIIYPNGILTKDNNVGGKVIFLYFKEIVSINQVKSKFVNWILFKIDLKNGNNLYQDVDNLNELEQVIKSWKSYMNQCDNHI